MVFRKQWIASILLILCVFSLSACGISNKKSSRPAPARKSGSKKEAKPTLPPQFSTIEFQALKLYNGESEWNESEGIQKQLRAEWNGLQSDLKKAKVPKEKTAAVELHLNGIETGIKAKDRFKTAEQANELIGALQGLAQKFKTEIPPEIILLQTDLREIRLHSAAGNWTILGDLSKSMQKDWKKLKPKVKKAGAEATGKNFDVYFKELDTAIKAKDEKKVQEILGLLESDAVTLRNTLASQKTGKQ